MAKIRLNAPAERTLEAFSQFLAVIPAVGAEQVDRLTIGQLRGLHAQFWEAFDAAEAEGAETFAFNPKRDEGGRFAPGNGAMGKRDDDEDEPGEGEVDHGPTGKTYGDGGGSKMGGSKESAGTTYEDGSTETTAREEAKTGKAVTGKHETRYEDEDKRGQPLDEETGRRSSASKGNPFADEAWQQNVPLGGEREPKRPDRRR